MGRYLEIVRTSDDTTSFYNMAMDCYNHSTDEISCAGYELGEDLGYVFPLVIRGKLSNLAGDVSFSSFDGVSHALVEYDNGDVGLYKRLTEAEMRQVNEDNQTKVTDLLEQMSQCKTVNAPVKELLNFFNKGSLTLKGLVK